MNSQNCSNLLPSIAPLIDEIVQKLR